MRNAAVIFLFVACVLPYGHAAVPVALLRLADTTGHPPSEFVDAKRWIQDTVQRMRTEEGVTVSDECSSTMGTRFIEDWKKSKVEYCRPPKPGNDPSPTSSINIYPKTANGKDFVIAELFNVVIDSQDFQQPGDKDMPLPKFGSVKVACSVQADSVANNYLTKEVSQRWFKMALQDNQGPVVGGACGPGAVNVVEHPVMFHYRYDTTNAFHNLEDVTMAFSMLATIDADDVKSKGVELVVVDAKSPGFYMEIWERLSAPYPVRFLKDHPFPPNTCFRHVLVNHYAFDSFLSYKGVGVKDMCPSEVIRGLNSWLHAMFKELRFTKPRQFPSTQNNVVTSKSIIWITRRDAEAIHGHNWNSWQRIRIYDEEHTLIKRLSSAVLEFNDQACFRAPRAGLKTPCRPENVVFEFTTIELSNVAFYPEQLLRLFRCHILIGVHGAGMGNEIWQVAGGKSGVVEVLHNVPGNWHYHNIAHFLGHHYQEVSSDGKAINMDGTVEALKKMMATVAKVK